MIEQNFSSQTLVLFPIPASPLPDDSESMASGYSPKRTSMATGIFPPQDSFHLLWEWDEDTPHMYQKWGQNAPFIKRVQVWDIELSIKLHKPTRAGVMVDDKMFTGLSQSH